MAQIYSNKDETLTEEVKQEYQSLLEQSQCFNDLWKSGGTYFERYIFIHNNKFIVILYYWFKDEIEYIGVFDKMSDFMLETKNWLK